MPTRDQMVAAFGSEEAYLAHMAAIGRRGGQRKVKKGVAKRGGWRAVVEQAVRAAKLTYLKELLAIYRARTHEGDAMFDFDGVLTGQIAQLEAEEAQAKTEASDR